MQVSVSMVLSFMVVWDLPMIAAGVKSLESSRLSTIYSEVAPSVQVFGKLFGRALQAQVRCKAVKLGRSLQNLPTDASNLQIGFQIFTLIVFAL